MIELKLSKKLTVKLYESADEMPMDLYFMAGQYAMMDYEIGSSIEGVNRRFERLDTFMMQNLRDEMIQERKNMHQTFFNIITTVHFPSLQFGCHVYSINDKRVDDYSTKNLIAIMKRMGAEGFTYKNLVDTLEGIKKKMKQELALMFPDKYTDTSKLNYLAQLKAKVVAELNYVIEEDMKFINEIRRVNDYLLALISPKNIDWNSTTNIVVVAKKAYEKLCSVLMQTGIQHPGQLSVVKFHLTVDTYESKRRPKTR